MRYELEQGCEVYIVIGYDSGFDTEEVKGCFLKLDNAKEFMDHQGGFFRVERHKIRDYNFDGKRK